MREETKPKQANIHEGHRGRLHDSYLRSGLEGFSDVVALELLLCYAIPRRDVNGLAHRLLQHFGSLYDVFNAPVSQLAAVDGMTERAAVLLNLQSTLAQRCVESQLRSVRAYTRNDDCAELLCKHLRGLHEEQVWMLSLDAKCKLIECRCIGEGSGSFVSLPPRRVVEAALGINACSVMLAHNHKSGVALPSREDVELSRLIKQALGCVDVYLIDHIIVADGDYVSMNQSGLL